MQDSASSVSSIPVSKRAKLLSYSPSLSQIAPAPPTAAASTLQPVAVPEGTTSDTKASSEDDALPSPTFDTSETYQHLTGLDDDLCEALEKEHIRLVRTEWLLKQPPNFRMVRRQELEELEENGEVPTPLMQPNEAVALVRQGNRSAGAASYGWAEGRDPG
jgi:hypothetical protein